MKFFLDTANLDELKKAASWGIVDGVTTNPTLIAKEGRPIEEHIRMICDIVDGDISAEVVSTEAGAMIKEGRELARLPEHAVICDLAVDPYILDAHPPTVRGIEGIPQGDLDRYAFEIDDLAWNEVPAEVPTSVRRRVVSCYSWPGVHPQECMELYGKQMAPLLTALAERGGATGLRSDGSFEERALIRGRMPRLEAALVAVPG